MRYNPRTGAQVYETSAWESVRSDSHQLSARVGTDLWLQGSPARLFADGDAVFGAGAARELDLNGVVNRFRAVIGFHLGHELPPSAWWKVSRIDVTENLALESLADVRVALGILRNCEGGRYRISQQAGDTCYWSHTSALRAGKAYAKGPHLAYLMKNPKYAGRMYSIDEIELANRLLRLELTLGSEWFRRHPWHEITPQNLRNEWADYFERMIGGAEIVNDENLRERVIAAGKTKGQGKAAFVCYTLIKSEGWQRARDMHSKSSWYRHIETLKKAGLRDADISAGNVVQLRKKIIEFNRVESWQQLSA
jgi:II/X family phage/plasmid replication protein